MSRRTKPVDLTARSDKTSLMPRRADPHPIADLTAEERAVMVAALSQFEVAKAYAAGLETKSTIGGRARRIDLYRDARIAGRLCERLLL